MSVFEEPQRLIFWDSTSGKPLLVDYVMDQLTSVKKQFNVITIAGLYRTGKSYLMTRIAGKYKGFPLGASAQSKTKGIWAWCMDHPVHQDQALLLLDTEGLGDVKKGNCNNDNQICTLAMLLSSTFIYNSFGAFDDTALNRLNFIAEMSKKIKTLDVSQSTASDDEFDVYFPELILALRDSSLDLEADGKELSPDEYLEYCLKCKEDGLDIQSFNEPRLCIQKCFKNRKCFVFDRPASRSNLKNLEELKDSDLNQDFVEDTNRFLDYVHHQTSPMKLKNGTPVTGRRFCALLRSYIDAISKGAIPCIKSALRSMAKIENESAVKEAIDTYRNEMSTKLPTQDEQDLRDVHLKSKDAALDHFLNMRVLDDKDTYKSKLDERVKEEYEKFVSMNKKQSRERCRDKLDKLHESIASKYNAGAYFVPEGYELYRSDVDKMKQTYDKTDGLGVMKNEVYIEFIDNIELESKSVQRISEKEIALRYERESKKRAEERAEYERKLREQKSDDWLGHLAPVLLETALGVAKVCLTDPEPVIVIVDHKD